MLHTCKDQLPQKLPQARRAAASQTVKIYSYILHTDCVNKLLVLFDKKKFQDLEDQNVKTSTAIVLAVPPAEMVLLAGQLSVCFA
jgi:hypothetical protein